jgi:hypothetical protein
VQSWVRGHGGESDFVNKTGGSVAEELYRSIYDVLLASVGRRAIRQFADQCAFRGAPPAGEVVARDGGKIACAGFPRVGDRGLRWGRTEDLDRYSAYR